ncbi:hypothetical protein FA95DRAFT_269945 [Auriscalpium vulgare]|uniref:Uncharacterized protein n=1 Tax=Auriscalpium vulgare TaxID=40419 RepID=A0ACB8S657_9AGAM|nr:hypothetical protein FA95DRAFT_269945 [Auriscalpium vulgare]
MQRAHVSMGRDILLLQLHRSFFTETVNRPEMFVSHHPYLVSAAATVYSACQMISCMETVYGKQPALASRFTYFWSSTMAGALSLCVLMSRVPFCAFVPLLRPHLESCLALFRRASSSSPKAEQCTPLLEEMVGKANLAYTRWCEGLKAGPADEVPGFRAEHASDARASVRRCTE